MGRRARRRAMLRVRQAVAAILLMGFVAGFVGIPVMSPTRKDRSRPYPCQDHACGCASADECWRHCCCFTNRQKVEWARQHGVTPPDFVVAAAAANAVKPRMFAGMTRAAAAGARQGCCCHTHQVREPDAERPTNDKSARVEGPAGVDGPCTAVPWDAVDHFVAG